MTDGKTHYVPYDAELFFGGRKARALCGRLVDLERDCAKPDDFPTCQTCAKRLAEFEALTF